MQSNGTFTCEVCKKTYVQRNDEEWNDYKALLEFKKRFQNKDDFELALLCDKCYRKIIKEIESLSDKDKKEIGYKSGLQENEIK